MDPRYLRKLVQSWSYVLPPYIVNDMLLFLDARFLKHSNVLPNRKSLRFFSQIIVKVCESGEREGLGQVRVTDASLTHRPIVPYVMLRCYLLYPLYRKRNWILKFLHFKLKWNRTNKKEWAIFILWSNWQPIAMLFDSQSSSQHYVK